MADIARRVGLVPSAIYRHFRGKDEVLDAVLDLIGRLLLGNVQAVQGEGGKHLERLRRLLMRHVRFVRENRAIPRIVFSDEITSRNPARKARAHGIIRAFLDRVAGMARAGQEEGEIRSDLDPETVALLLLGIVQPGAILWHLSDGGFDVTKHAERAWRLVRAAIDKAER
jgi:AcrR family transcriptional regulator